MTGSEILSIGVADVPAISNFTDLEALARESDVRVVRLAGPTEEHLDALIFPGTKNTAEALRFVTSRGLDRVAQTVAARGGTVIGLCGGFQILGRRILDPHGVESADRELAGLGLLDVVTRFARDKVTVGVSGIHSETGCRVTGYEIHMGETILGEGAHPLLRVQTDGESAQRPEGAVSLDGRILGTYVHGLFDAAPFRRLFLNRLRARSGWAPLEARADTPLDQDLDRLADFMGSHLDLKQIDAIIEQGMSS